MTYILQNSDRNQRERELRQTLGMNLFCIASSRLLPFTVFDVWWDSECFWQSNYCDHCVKSVQIRSFFWSVFSCIRTEYRKIRTRNKTVFGHFSRSGCLWILFFFSFKFALIINSILIDVNTECGRKLWVVNLLIIKISLQHLLALYLANECGSFFHFEKLRLYSAFGQKYLSFLTVYSY